MLLHYDIFPLNGASEFVSISFQCPSMQLPFRCQHPLCNYPSELTFRCQHSLCNYPSDVLLISHMSVCMHVPLCGLPCIKPMDWYVDIMWSYTYGVLLMRSDYPSVRVQKCAWCGSIQRCAWCGSIWRCAWCGSMLRCAWWVKKICGVCAICCVVTAWGY